MNCRVSSIVIGRWGGEYWCGAVPCLSVGSISFGTLQRFSFGGLDDAIAIPEDAATVTTTRSPRMISLSYSTTHIPQ
jgi:hypothetical protein